jgi:hypothetical protein
MMAWNDTVVLQPVRLQTKLEAAYVYVNAFCSCCIFGGSEDTAAESAFRLAMKTVKPYLRVPAKKFFSAPQKILRLRMDLHGANFDMFAAFFSF